MVSAVAVVVTGALNQTAVWVAAALLVLLMFSSYALGRRRSQSTPPVGRSRNDRNLQFLTIDHYQPGLRRLCLASVSMTVPVTARDQTMGPNA